MGLGFSGACVVGLNMYLLSNTLGHVFTDDSQVLEVPRANPQACHNTHSTSQILQFTAMHSAESCSCPASGASLMVTRAVVNMHAALLTGLWALTLLCLQTVNRMAPLLALYSAFNGSGSVLAGALK